MNYGRVEGVAPPDYLLGEPDEFRTASNRSTRRQERVAARLERDRARGYSINVKQVVLAFAIEFFIIGIILTGQVYFALDSTDAAHKVVPVLLFPLALAVMELARVPLAISVRTAQSWNIQFAALVGVCCAIVVTSASLYQIGEKSFSQRLEAVNAKRAVLDEAKAKKSNFAGWRADAESVVEKLRKDRDALAERVNTLTATLKEMVAHAQQCHAIFQKKADGTESKSQRCQVNPLLKPVQAEHNDAKQKLQDANAALVKAEDVLRQQLMTEAGAHEQILRKAEADYKQAILNSPMHGYTAMFFGMAPAEVTEGQVKTFQQYIIGLPSIAAAFSSTLIAMAAVRRIRRKETEEAVSLPDEAAAYLFGPLVTAIRVEANNAISAALNSNNRGQAPPSDAAGTKPT
jgi:hypothetical protein